jgi:hypothetical protein
VLESHRFFLLSEFRTIEGNTALHAPDNVFTRDYICESKHNIGTELY